MLISWHLFLNDPPFADISSLARSQPHNSISNVNLIFDHP